MAAWLSTVPDAMDALIATLDGADALAGVPVVDYPLVSAASAQKAVIIGCPPDETGWAVEGVTARQGPGIDRSREQYTIYCAAKVQNGNGKPSESRRAAYGLVGAVGTVLAANKTLGGAVMSAQVGDSMLRYGKPERGILVAVEFQVVIDAFTQL